MAISESGGTSGAAAKPWLIVLTASADGIQAIGTILSELPHDFPAAIIVVQHRPADVPIEPLTRIFSQRAHMPVIAASESQEVSPGTVYVARSESHLTITPERTFAYRDGRRIHFRRSSANPLLESAAAVFGERAVAVVLTGLGSDATDGVQSIKMHGGIVLAQDSATATHWEMPGAAVRSGSVDLVLPIYAMSSVLTAIVRGRPVTGLRRAEAGT